MDFEKLRNMPIRTKIISIGENELHDDELRAIMGYSPLFFVYNYWSGDYEGSGYAFYMSKDHKFDYECLSHCSCNGPVDDFDGSARYKTVKELLDACTEELKGYLKPLVDTWLKSEAWDQNVVKKGMLEK